MQGANIDGMLINGLEQLFAGDQDFADDSAAESEGELSEEDKMAASVAEKMAAFMARSNPASPQPVPKVEKAPAKSSKPSAGSFLEGSALTGGVTQFASSSKSRTAPAAQQAPPRKQRNPVKTSPPPSPGLSSTRAPNTPPRSPSLGSTAAPTRSSDRKSRSTTSPTYASPGKSWASREPGESYVPPIFTPPTSPDKRQFRGEIPRQLAAAADIERLSDWWGGQEAESYPEGWESSDWLDPNIDKLRDEGISNSIVSVFEKVRAKQSALHQQRGLLPEGSPVFEASPQREYGYIGNSPTTLRQKEQKEKAERISPYRQSPSPARSERKSPSSSRSKSPSADPVPVRKSPVQSKSPAPARRTPARGARADSFGEWKPRNARGSPKQSPKPAARAGGASARVAARERDNAVARSSPEKKETEKGASEKKESAPAPVKQSSPREAKVQSTPAAVVPIAPKSPGNKKASKQGLEEAWEAMAASLIGTDFSLDRGSFGAFKCTVLSNGGYGRGLKIQYKIDGDTETVKLVDVTAGILKFNKKQRNASAHDQVCVDRATELEDAIRDPMWKGSLDWSAEDVMLGAAKARAAGPTPAQPAPSPAARPSSNASAAQLKQTADERRKKLLDVFGVFDFDSSNQIEVKELLELGKARRSLGQKSRDWTEAKNARMMKKMDTDGDGDVSSTEFSVYFEAALTQDPAEFDNTIAQFTAVAQACRDRKERVASNVFDSIDTNKDGVIDRQEMEAALDQGLVASAVKASDLPLVESSADFGAEFSTLAAQMKDVGLVKDAQTLADLSQSRDACISFIYLLRTMYIPANELSYSENAKALANKSRPRKVSAEAVEAVKGVCARLGVIAAELD